jgi:hypothetical protein
MQKLIFFVLFFTTKLAFSWTAKVGDKASWLWQEQDSGVFKEFRFDMTVVNTYTDGGYSYDYVNTDLKSGESQRGWMGVDGRSAQSERTRHLDILKHCEKLGGTNKISLINGTSIKTCELTEYLDGTKLSRKEYGDVPFYLVSEIHSYISGSVTYTLISFEFGP